MENLGGYQPPYVQNITAKNDTLSEKPKRRWPWVAIIVLLVVYVTAVSLWPAPKVTATVNNISLPKEDVTLPFPAYGTSAVGVQGDGVLATSSNQKAAPIASTAKIMTALAVLKAKPLKIGENGPTITIEQADVDYYNEQVREGGSTVPVKLGQNITERKALEMLLIPSANNIAFTLSRWAFGSVENYSKFANNYAKELGATNSNFTDPSGFKATTTSTAKDLVLLAEKLMQNEVTASIVKMQRVNLDSETSLPSTNSFLVLKPDVIGVKTGHHDEAGGCFVVAIESKTVTGETLRIISAVTNAPNLIQAMNDSYAVAQATAGQISERNVITTNQAVGTYSAPWGVQADATASSGLSVLAWKGSKLEPKTSLAALSPSPDNAVAGKVNIKSISGQEVSMAVKLNQELAAPSFLWRLTHPLKLISG